MGKLRYVMVGLGGLGKNGSDQGRQILLVISEMEILPYGNFGVTPTGPTAKFVEFQIIYPTPHRQIEIIMKIIIGSKVLLPTIFRRGGNRCVEFTTVHLTTGPSAYLYGIRFLGSRLCPTSN
jgi:hypothetical protein